MENLRWKRVLIKLSGEALGDKETGEIYIDEKIDRIARIITELTDAGAQIAVVIGAGNIWRGGKAAGIRRARADQMGMLATMMNCLRLEDALEKAGTPVTVMSSIPMPSFAEQYNFRTASEYLENGKVVIFGGGLGVPTITTDTACVVRAKEIEADIVLMAKSVDGVYTSDPKKSPDAKKYKIISSNECVEKDLRAIDASAAAIADEVGMNAYAFSLDDPENILRVVRGEKIGTFLSADKKTVAEFYPEI